MNRKITRSEALALEKQFNLSDAHTYQHPTDIENEHIFGNLSSIYIEAMQNRGPRLDESAFNLFMKASLQESACVNQWFLPTYSASVSTEIIANALHEQIDCIYLPEPTFDNIADIFRRNGFALTPIPIAENRTYIQAILDIAEEDQSIIKCIFLVLPNNPTGHNIPEEDFGRLVSMCKKNSITLIIDFCFRVFDFPNIYDHHKILKESGVQYVAIEDTGKIWPTLDLKISYICASENFRNTITAVYDDFLLNVSPFISEMVKRYSELELSNEFFVMRSNISRNRHFLRTQVQKNKWSLEVPFTQSSLSVEIVRFTHEKFDSVEFSEYCLERGVGILSGSAFYWNAKERGNDQIRIALARPTEYFEHAVLHLFNVVGEYYEDHQIC